MHAYAPIPCFARWHVADNMLQIGERVGADSTMQTGFGVDMQSWKFATLAVALLAQPLWAQGRDRDQDKSGRAPVAQAANNSCLAALGPLGSAPNSAIRVVDGASLKDPGDVRSLRSKAKDNAPIVIRGGDFAGKKFGNDDFTNLCFDGTNLLGTRWSRSKADGAAFVNANLTGAIFDRASLRGVLFRNSILSQVDATGTELSYGQFDGGWEPSIAGLKLDNARMIGFRFVCGSSSADGCSFDRKQLSLRGANLTNASIATFSMWDVLLDDVILDNTEIAIDQMSLLRLARIAGPLQVRVDNRRIALNPDAFRAAAGAFETSRAPDTECTAPANALSQIFCQAGRGDLKAYRDDVNRLYESTLTPIATANTAPINVTAPTGAQDRYMKAMRKCVLKEEEDVVIACLYQTMSKRRTVLVAQLVKAKPLESEGRAVYVGVQTPMVQAVSRNPALSAFAPLIVGDATSLLLAYRDENEKLIARGYAQKDGERCTVNFATPVGKRPARAGPNFAAWYSGAEFTIGSAKTKKIKKKKVRKVKGRKVASEPVAFVPTTGCRGVIQSGPLVRVPISDEDFDQLWIARAAKT